MTIFKSGIPQVGDHLALAYYFGTQYPQKRAQYPQMQDALRLLEGHPPSVISFFSRKISGLLSNSVNDLIVTYVPNNRPYGSKGLRWVLQDLAERNEYMCQELFSRTTILTAYGDTCKDEDEYKRTLAVIDPNAVKGRRILICDEVSTTGIALSSCRKLLLAAGATEVYTLTLARNYSHNTTYSFPLEHHAVLYPQDKQSGQQFKEDLSACLDGRPAIQLPTVIDAPVTPSKNKVVGSPPQVVKPALTQPKVVLYYQSQKTGKAADKAASILSQSSQSRLDRWLVKTPPIADFNMLFPAPTHATYRFLATPPDSDPELSGSAASASSSAGLVRSPYFLSASVAGASSSLPGFCSARDLALGDITNRIGEKKPQGKKRDYAVIGDDDIGSQEDFGLGRLAPRKK